MIAASEAVQYLTPSSFEEMRACRLRYELRHTSRGAARQGPPAARIGQLCHRVVQRLIEENLLPGSQWPQRFDRVWAEETLALPTDPGYRAPELWPGYALKKVGLKRALAELNAMLTSNGIPATIQTELVLKSNSGHLRGRLDVLCQVAGRWQVIDLKTGRIDSGIDRGLNSSYRRQVQLYAYLVAQQTGEWPSEAVVLPLEGAAVHVGTDPGTCETIAREAQELLNVYNSTLPGTQPDTVSGDTCPSCPVAARCPAFWAKWKSEYAPDLIAYRGEVVAVYRALNGRTAVRVAVKSGDEPEIFIQGLDEAVHPNVTRLRPESFLSVVGLKPAGQPGRFWLAPGGDLAVSDAE